MRLRAFPIVVAALALCASLALAEPRMILDYANGVPRLTLTGDYAGASYTVYRAPLRGGAFEPITRDRVLCLGACFTEDRTALPGESYRYRFDMIASGGQPGALLSYGPFEATISPALSRAIGVYAFPNPGHGATTVQLHLAGRPGDAAARGEAAIYDLAGRQQRVIHQGLLARGLTTLTWDGRDARGTTLPGGVYLLKFTAGGQQTVTRLVRR